MILLFTLFPTPPATLFTFKYLLNIPPYRSVSPSPAPEIHPPHPHPHVRLREVWRQSSVGVSVGVGGDGGGGWGSVWRMVIVTVVNF